MEWKHALFLLHRGGGVEWHAWTPGICLPVEHIFTLFRGEHHQQQNAKFPFQTPERPMSPFSPPTIL
jgi:hypothetical protein